MGRDWVQSFWQVSLKKLVYIIVAIRYSMHITEREVSFLKNYRIILNVILSILLKKDFPKVRNILLQNFKSFLPYIYISLLLIKIISNYWINLNIVTHYHKYDKTEPSLTKREGYSFRYQRWSLKPHRHANKDGCCLDIVKLKQNMFIAYQLCISVILIVEL